MVFWQFFQEIAKILLPSIIIEAQHKTALYSPDFTIFVKLTTTLSSCHE